jgi:cell division transport system ATP-binding protein
LEPLIQFENVGMRYGSGPEVLRDLSFEIPRGSFHFIRGPSGAGKSSLLRLLYLGARPSRGEIRLFGRRSADLKRRELPPIRRRIGVVFQDFRLIDHLSALDNVMLPLRLAGASGGEAREHVAELLRWVGLGSRMHALPPTLSGGEAQRVAIARAVVGKPDLLLADEPTGNLDDRIGARLIHLFEQLNQIGTTVILATHNQTLAGRIRHSVLHLENGLLVDSAADVSRIA